MRLRNIAGAREVIAESPFVVHEEETQRGKWKQLFGNDAPLYVEIGMGKGQFLMEQARRNPHINFVGIEKYSSVLLRALQKQEEELLPNIKFIRMDAERIAEVFAPGEVQHLFLNFSDPWPKERNAKRRLMSHQFLGRYEHILADSALVEFKTDNRSLFSFALEELAAMKWEVSAVTYDLHHDPQLSQNNVMTEYEERFSMRGNTICMLRACPPGV
ncbi:MAG: tRNA (guanosine(46)-N7)-methyltransferase TrmB [Lachnospiraceae bacterium]